MADKYTYADVIIDPEDPRVEIGAEYYFGDNPGEVLKWANDDNGVAKAIDRIDRGNFPFCHDGIRFPCIIRKKEPVKKYVPFDLSLEEVRKSLKGRWIKSTDGEYQISGFHSFDGEDGTEWKVVIAYRYISPEVLLVLWTFDDGTPCGELVEEVNHSQYSRQEKERISSFS